MKYLDLADYLVIAGAILNVEPETLLHYVDLHLAESALAAPTAAFGGTEFYQEFHVKAAVLGWHLVKNHPLPDGNKRAGFISMVEFVERNGHIWCPPENDLQSEGEETVKTIEGVASGAKTVEQLADWIRDRIE